jgi:hypothetical protein
VHAADTNDLLTGSGQGVYERKGLVQALVHHQVYATVVKGEQTEVRMNVDREELLTGGNVQVSVHNLLPAPFPRIA